MITLHVPMIARDALLLPIGCGEGHRGLWFYDPNVYGPINTGDVVSFVSGGDEVIRGVVVTEDAYGPSNEEFQRYCSRVNGKVFKWIEDEPAVIAAA